MKSKSGIITLSCVVVATLILSACKKQPDECILYSTAQVTKVTGPRTVSVNQEADFTLKYILRDGCGRFENLQSTSSGNTITISLLATYQGCMCTDILLGGEATYKFKSSLPGVYYLNFVQPNKTLLIDSVIVN
ncbi:MAG: hypothetical protein V4722_02040 [Bacteroidota bacterium]